MSQTNDALQLNTPSTSLEARDSLVDLLQTDLIGPDPDNKHHNPMLEEQLNQAPTSWYLTGFLAPTSAPYITPDENSVEELEEGELGAVEALKKVTPDEADDSLKTPSTTAFSSTMGLSAYLPEEAQTLHIVASWGDYERLPHESSSEQEVTLNSDERSEGEDDEHEESAQEGKKSNKGNQEVWQRHDRRVELSVSLHQKELEQGLTLPLEGTQWRAHTGQVSIYLLVRAIPNSSLKSLSCFLINERVPDGERPRDEAYLFQTKLKLSLSRQGELKSHQENLFEQNSAPVQASLHLNPEHKQRVSFSPAPEHTLSITEENDDFLDQSRDALIYRQLPRYGSGQHCALQAHHTLDETGESVCYNLTTTWRPKANVLFVSHRQLDQLNTRLIDLSQLNTHAELCTTLKPLLSAYQQWIDAQLIAKDKLTNELAKIATGHIAKHNEALYKIKLSLEVLKEPKAFNAFKTMNRVIRGALLQQKLVRWLEESPKNTRESFGEHLQANNSTEEPRWRLFQLAFILMNLPGLTLEEHQSSDKKELFEFENEQVDLLFFPTGGGKTEAYLGLSAFTLTLRRLRDPSRASGGVSVLMRYTLRLLTLDQLGRIAALICALELERTQRTQELGEWPFEVGLWVGQHMTPNRLAKKNPRDQNAAVVKIKAYQEDDKERNYPFPLRSCPWCGSLLTKDSFEVSPSLRSPQDLRLICPDSKALQCPFASMQGRGIPVLMIDDMIYKRLPAFLIATVDKFAQLPWRAEVGALFGQVSHYHSEGYISAQHIQGATALEKGRLPPPRLIIQDELHLISGPLGTMVGLYEVAINTLSQAEGFPKPKLIASTATARRAEQQIKALYGRDMRVFPPPGLSVRDNFFSQQEDHTPQTPARLYVGLSAPGRAHKGVQLVASLTLLAGAKTLWDLAHQKKLSPNPVDPYMTIVGYYNTLRELGGSRRIAEDEIASRLTQYSERKRLKGDIFTFANRDSLSEIVELTSRVSSAEVADSKARLALPYSKRHASKHIDIALATNMISVGLDISRLGLMMVLGQPKSAAEYIQATSRVGRDKARPGLVLTLLNHHRSRDRGHFQEFQTWHESFYRRVEANSLTPFSSRALERGFVGAATGLTRHLSPLMTPAQSPKKIQQAGALAVIDQAIDHFEAWVKHALTSEDHSLEESKKRVREAGERLKQQWLKKAKEYEYHIQYGKEPPATEKPLLTHPEEVDQDELTAPMSLRDVEPSIGLWRVDHINKREDWPHHVRFTSPLFKVPAEAHVRRSQLITTFGPGAMIDLPDRSGIIAHTNTWNKSSQPLKEPRLRLQVAKLLNSPDIELYEPHIDSKTRKSGVAYYEFPGWMLVNSHSKPITIHGDSYRRRILLTRNNGRLTDHKKGRSGKRFQGVIQGVERTIYDVVPIRFVQACPKGHLADINWRAFVHQGVECSQELYFDEAGSGHNFTKIFVSCACGKRRKLADAKKTKALGRCNGGQPWIQLKHRSKCLDKCGANDCSHHRCTEDAHLLTRTATNAYFSNVVSVLSLPPEPPTGAQSRGAMYLEALKAHNLKPHMMTKDFLTLFLNPEMDFYKIIKAFDETLLSTPDQIWQDIQALQAQATGQLTEEQEENLKAGKLTRPEVSQFLNVPQPSQAGERFMVSDFEHFEAERLLLTDRPKWFQDSIDRVILMHRLREVSALIGFTRLEPLAGEDDIPTAQQMQIERASLTAGQPTWVPSVQNLGEGVFFSLNPERVKAWAERPQVKARMASFNQGRELMERESMSERPIRERDAAYVLLHTLSHALIEEIALSCGYSASALKERIYSFENAYGVLIYTGTSSSDGTLGGLVDQSVELHTFMKGALKRLTLCASDPICSSHKPEDPLTKRYLHGAACHSCSLISETSCGARNLWLDRAFVVPTLDEHSASFFSEQDLQGVGDA